MGIFILIKPSCMQSATLQTRPSLDYRLPLMICKVTCRALCWSSKLQKINVCILMDKLLYVGFDVSEYNWLKSCLNSTVQINFSFSLDYYVWASATSVKPLDAVNRFITAESCETHHCELYECRSFPSSEVFLFNEILFLLFW